MNRMPFFSDSVSSDAAAVVRESGLGFCDTNTCLLCNVSLYGTNYQRDMFVLTHKREEDIYAGKIMTILVRNGEHVHFVVTVPV